MRRRPRSVLLVVFVVTLLTLVACAQSTPPPPAATPLPSPPPPPQEKEPEWWPKKPALAGGLLVVVENHNRSRPQSGLDKADTVFEADVVGGISRFLALFYRQEASEIGPIRSARWSFFHLAQGYELPFAHAGANVDVMAEIGKAKKQGFPSLDEIYGAGPYFWRSNQRSSPHNLYTSTTRLMEGVKAMKYPVKPPTEFSVLAKGEQLPGGEPAVSLRVPYQTTGPNTNVVTWAFSDGHYIRSTNGEPHLLTSGSPITVENIIVLFTDTEDVVKFGEPVKENRITGEGKSLFFVAGKVYQGTWLKPRAQDPLKFMHDGRPVRLTPGRTWVHIVDKKLEVSYQKE